jgi:hypothetical protein
MVLYFLKGDIAASQLWVEEQKESQLSHFLDSNGTGVCCEHIFRIIP